MSWVAIAVTVGSAVVGAYEQHQVAKKQDNALAAQLRQQQESESRVNQRTHAMIAAQQAQTDEPQKTAAAKAYQTALQANQAQASAPLATVGNVSEAYKKAGSDAALGISNYGKQQGDLTAAIDAPGQQRRDNQRNINDFGIDVDQINRHQRNQNSQDAMAFNAIHANPYVGLLTKVAQAYAGSRAGGAGGGSSGGGWSNFNAVDGSGSAYGGYT
jgi:hypothetical protein